MRAQEDVSDLWSDSENSDGSHYKRDEIRIDVDNQIVTSLHGALQHGDKEEEVPKFKHDRNERRNQINRREKMAKTFIQWFQKDQDVNIEKAILPVTPQKRKQAFKLATTELHDV